MRRLTAILFLALAILLGRVGEGWNADYHKGWDALYRGEYTTALKWFAVSAEQGDPYAQYSLGYLYENGRGVIKDNVRAHMWYHIAASQGYKYATTNRDLIAEKLTSAEMITTQKLARECVRKKYKGCWVIGNLDHKITCHFCFEKFEIDAEVQEDFTGHNTEIYDCVVCCNPNKLSYEVHDGEITSLIVGDGNE